MPNVAISPILEAKPVPGSSVATMVDSMTVPAWAGDALEVRVGGALINATPSHDRTSWSLIRAKVPATVPPLAVARINRLLAGTGAPKLEWYHRTGGQVFRAKGKAVSLPATVTLRWSPTMDRWTVTIDTAHDRAWLESHAEVPGTPKGMEVPPSVPPMVEDSRSIMSEVMAPGSPDAATLRAELGRLMAATATFEDFSTIPKGFSTIAEKAAKAFDEAMAMPAPDDEPTPEPEPVTEPEAKHALKLKPERVHADPLGIFTFPKPSAKGKVEITEDTARALELAMARHLAGDRQVIALFGPTGTGKTSLVYDLAAKHDIGVFQFDAAGATTFIDWAGTVGARAEGGATVTEWQPSAFIEAIRADGHYAGQLRIILVDEINRAESAAATNFLMTVTHGIAGVYIPDARKTVPIDPAAMIVYSGNIGSAYNATIPLDPALVNRIGATVWLDYPDQATERKIVASRVKLPGLTDGSNLAWKLVDAARQSRTVADRGEIPQGISTRQLIVAAEWIAAGATPMQAAEWCWINTYSAEGGNSSDRAIVRTAVEATLRGLTVKR